MQETRELLETAFRQIPVIILEAMPKGTTLAGLVIIQVGITPLGTSTIPRITRPRIASILQKSGGVLRTIPATTILVTSIQIQATHILATHSRTPEIRSTTRIQEIRSTTRHMLAVLPTQETQETQGMQAVW